MTVFFPLIVVTWSICCIVSIIIYGIFVFKWYKSSIKASGFYQDCKDIKKDLDKKFSLFKKETSVTILICARNEAKNLEKYLPQILNQRIPPNTSVEVLVVDDASEDKTQEVLKKIEALHKKKCEKSFFRSPKKRKKRTEYVENIKKVTFINDFKKKSKKNHIKYLQISISFCNLHIRFKKQIGKKFALAQGIQAAKGEWILVTDADCYPNSEYWLWTMLAARKMTAKETTAFVLGYSPYAQSSKKTFLNKWIRFEALFTLCQYATTAYWKYPYMGVGRNMLYRKITFTESYNWEKNADLASGDDDLFVNATARGNNTVLSLSPLSWVYSLPSTTWKSYFKQKKRHFTTGTRYTLIHKIILGIWTQSHVWFWLLLPIVLLVSNADLYYFILLLYLIRTAIFAIVISKLCSTFRTKELIYYIPLLDILLAIYYIIFAPILMLNINLKTWN